MLAAADELIRFTKRMEHAGVPTHQAQEQSAAIIDLVGSLHDSYKPVTQDDLFRVKVELETRIAGFKVELETRIVALDAKIEAKHLETKAQISDTKTEIAHAKADIIKWMLGQNVLILLAIFGLIHSMAK